MNTQDLAELMPLLVPLLVVQIILLGAALIDLVPRSQTRGPKWVWFIVVIAFSILGPVMYFIFGRDET